VSDTNESPLHVSVTEAGLGEELFSFSPWTVPAVGEFIHFSFMANDEPEWAPESWTHGKALNGSVWKVVRVHHLVRVNRVGVGGKRYRAVVEVVHVQGPKP